MRTAIRSHRQGIKQLMAPCRFLFPILEKIYPVFDPCKSWGRDVIPRSLNHVARCQQTNTYHTRHIYTLAAHDNVRGFDKQISRRSISATDTTVHITSYREYINNLVCKQLRLFLSYTVSIVSSEETSRSRHIMAQSAATKLPLVHPAEAPAQTSTSITTIHRNPVTSPEEVPINVYLPLNPVLTITAPGPAVASVTDTPSDSSPDSSIPQDSANAFTDDKDDIWLAIMAIRVVEFSNGGYKIRKIFA